MASNIYEEILSKALKSAPGEKDQKALLINLALEQKKLALASTIAIRRNDGETITDEEMVAAEDAASAYVDSVIAGIVTMDLDKLIEYNKRTKSKKLADGKVTGTLRRKKGIGSVFISPMDLRTLLNSMLYKYTQNLMGLGGRLRNRTGRLAQSGLVTKITDATGKKSQGKVSVFFRYMTAPYATFEPDKGAQGSLARSPKELFKLAINNALEDILTPKSKERISIHWLDTRRGS